MWFQSERGWEDKQRHLVLAKGTVWTALEQVIHANCGTRSVGQTFLSVSLAPWETTQGGKENSGNKTLEPAMVFRI